MENTLFIERSWNRSAEHHNKRRESEKYCVESARTCRKTMPNSEIINRKRRAAASITLTPQVGHKAISFQLKLEIIGEISPVTVSQNAYNGQ